MKRTLAVAAVLVLAAGPHAGAQFEAGSGKPRVNASVEAYAIRPGPEFGDQCFCTWLGVARGTLQTGGIASAHGQASIFDPGILWQQSAQPIAGADIPGTSETDLTLQNVPKDDNRRFIAPAPQGFPPSTFYASAPSAVAGLVPVLFVGQGAVGTTRSHVDSAPSITSSVVVSEGNEQKSGSRSGQITASVDASWRRDTLLETAVTAIADFKIVARDAAGNTVNVFSARKIESLAVVENDGSPGGQKVFARTRVVDGMVGMTPVVVDENGVSVAPQVPVSQALAARRQLDGTLAIFRITIRLLGEREDSAGKPPTRVEDMGKSGVLATAATHGVLFRLGPPPPPQSGSVSFVLAGASASILARPAIPLPATDFGSTDIAAPVAAPRPTEVLGEQLQATLGGDAVGGAPLTGAVLASGLTRRVVDEEIVTTAPPVGYVAGVVAFLLWLATALGFLFRRTAPVRALVAAPDRAWAQYARYLVKG